MMKSILAVILLLHATIHTNAIVRIIDGIKVLENSVQPPRRQVHQHHNHERRQQQRQQQQQQSSFSDRYRSPTAIIGWNSCSTCHKKLKKSVLCRSLAFHPNLKSVSQHLHPLQKAQAATKVLPIHSQSTTSKYPTKIFLSLSPASESQSSSSSPILATTVSTQKDADSSTALRAVAISSESTLTTSMNFDSTALDTEIKPSPDPIPSLSRPSVVEQTKTTDSAILAHAFPKVGVLFLNLGGPETEDDVEGFLYNLFADPDIIRLPGPLAPLQKLIALFISKRRAPKSRAAYESIGGGSPILKYSNEQADLVSKAIYERYGFQVQTYIGMRYWYPFTEEALEKIRNDRIEALVIVPLYPQFSISTSGSSLRVLQEEFSKNYNRYNGMVHTVVPSWYSRPGYIKVMADLIEQELQSFSADEIQEGYNVNINQKPLHVLFSAHGVPQSYIEAGDPYQRQIIECVDQIQAELMSRTHQPYTSLVDMHLSYQSRVGPIEWLRPYTDDVLPKLGQSGVKNLVVVPISFVSEHVETLEEIDIEYREMAEEYGIRNWRRCPALNTNIDFINDMADLVVDALQEPATTVTEACVTNNVGDVELQPLDERLSVTGVQGVGTLGQQNINNKNTLKEVQQQLQERWTGRIAFFAVLGIIVVELLSGKSLVSLFQF